MQPPRASARVLGSGCSAVRHCSPCRALGSWPSTCPESRGSTRLTHQPGCTSEKSIGLVDAVPWADDRVRESQADTEPALGRRRVPDGSTHLHVRLAYPTDPGARLQAKGARANYHLR